VTNTANKKAHEKLHHRNGSATLIVSICVCKQQHPCNAKHKHCKAVTSNQLTEWYCVL